MPRTADNRAITSFTPGNSTHLFDPTDNAALYTFQAGRMLEVTLIAKVF